MSWFFTLWLGHLVTTALRSTASENCFSSSDVCQAFVDAALLIFSFSSVGWGWTDTTALGYVNWAPGEPNAAFHPGEVGEESCVEMYDDGRWNDNNCMQKRGFACRHRQCETSTLDRHRRTVLTLNPLQHGSFPYIIFPYIFPPLKYVP